MPSKNIAPRQEIRQEKTLQQPIALISAKVSENETSELTEGSYSKYDLDDKNPETKQRKWAKTGTESDILQDYIKLDDLDINKMNYAVKSNKSTLEKANAKYLDLGIEKATNYFNALYDSNKRLKAEDITLGQVLITEYIKQGDTQKAIDIYEKTMMLGTESGQVSQALSIIQKMTPLGQLKMMERLVARAKAQEPKVFENVSITEEMKNKILNSYSEDGTTFNQEQLNKSLEEVKQEISENIKISIGDKITAYRCLSMLGNARTHIRNMVSNLSSLGSITLKDFQAASIEGIASKLGANIDRTKMLKVASSDVSNFVKKTVLEEKGNISGDSKFSRKTLLKHNAAVFKNKVLQGIYKFNINLLEKEDWIFSKILYKKALSNFLTANNIKTNADIQNNSDLIEKGKLYAVEQAQIGTFRQVSYLASKISEIERNNVLNRVVVGSAMPFKKTPINVAKAGFNYSPLGFTKTLTYDILQVKKGNMNPSELIDNIAKNTTGSALTLIGYMLAQMGFINGAGDDDKEAKYDYQLGEQSYSLNIGGKSYSLSWLSPVAMPLFVGANLYEKLVEKEGWNGDVVIDTLGKTLDPMTEMSFVSGLTSTLSSYETGTGKVFGIATEIGQNYITQFIPTLLSQIASTTDDTKRTIKVSGTSNFSVLDETVNKLKLKIPVLRQTLQPSIDIWGNEIEQNDNILIRGLENFLSPATIKTKNETVVDEQIKDLYDLTGEISILPTIPKNSITFDEKKYNMSAEEYTDYKQKYGITSYNLLQKLFKTETYKKSDEKEKANLISDVYSHAQDVAKDQFLSSKDVEYTNATEKKEKVYKENAIVGAIKNDISPEAYTTMIKDYGKYSVATAFTDYETYSNYKSEINEIESDKYDNGKTISGSRLRKVSRYVNELDLSIPEKAMLIKSEFPSYSTYNKEIVQYVSNMDTSLKNKKAIIEELGMRINKNGNVEW